MTRYVQNKEKKLIPNNFDILYWQELIEDFSYSQTVAMSRGRGFSSSRGSSYRGSSRGSSSWGSSRGYSTPRGGSTTSGRFSSFSNSFETPRPKYGSSTDRYGSSRSHSDDYRKPYKSVRTLLLL